MYYLKNPDSSGASTSLDKNTKKKTKVRNAIQCTKQTTLPPQIRIPAVPRRHWTKTLKKKKKKLGMQYNVQNK